MVGGERNTEYKAVIAQCRNLFLQKAKDYGTSWSVLRLPSVTDQLYIKAKRIRTIQETGENRVGESIEGEYIALVNYAAIGLIQLKRAAQGIDAFTADLALEEVTQLYDLAIQQAEDTYHRKNHDYGEAWRELRPTSFTDLILMKLLRIKQIEANDGQTLVSEGIDAGYIDILNYAVFALIMGGK
jgi:hypothetical protein